MKFFLKIHGSVLTAYAFLACLITYPLVLRLSGSIYGPFFSTDLRGAVWHLWWLKYSFLAGLRDSFCPFLCAPCGIDFTSTPFSSFAQWASKIAVIATNPLFFLNVSALLSLVLSGFFVYLIVLRLTEDRRSSFYAGMIFAFSPYHLNKLMEFGYVYIGTGLALYLLCLLRLEDRDKPINIVYAGLALGLTLNFSPYYGYFAIILTAIFPFFIYFYGWRSTPYRTRMRNALRFSFLSAVIFLGAFLLNAPLIIRTLGHFSHPATLAAAASPEYSRNFQYLYSQSARPLSYLLPASTHPVFGHFTKKMFGSFFYGRGSIEQTLFLGWSALFLAYLAFKQWKRDRQKKNHLQNQATQEKDRIIGALLYLCGASLLCSMPPTIDLLFLKIYFPSYFFHKLFPMFRAYARFGVLVSLFVSILAGFGLKTLLARHKTIRIQRFLSILFCVAAAFEFMNMPPAKTTLLDRIPAVHRWLAEQKGDFIVAEYPMAQGGSGEAFENYDYLYYQTFHQKRLINGCTSGTSCADLKEKFIKIDDKGALEVLESLGVKWIVLHKELYRSSEYHGSSDLLRMAPDLDAFNQLYKVAEFGNDSVYAFKKSKVTGVI